jgi:AcrR family transcriptional regulator
MPSPRRARVATPLSVDRIVDHAMGIADREGLDALSMRRLGAELGADPMAIYHHVRDKRSLLELMADRVVAGIAPDTGSQWQTAIRATVLRARGEMLRHPWMARVILDSDQPGPATLAYLDAVFGILRRGGLSLSLTHHAIHLFGSRLLGFSQDLFDDRAPERPDSAARESQAAEWETVLPYVAELARAARHDGALGGCDDDEEFALAIDVILEGLARRQ